jgi:hypothetical protein
MGKRMTQIRRIYADFGTTFGSVFSQKLQKIVAYPLTPQAG